MNRPLATSLLGLLTALSSFAAEIPAGVRDALKQLQQYDQSQPRAPLFILEQFVARSSGTEQGPQIAALLADALASPETTPVARTILCQQLVLVGTDAQVPLLAKLLDDPQLSDAARYALEGQQSADADAALRAALARLGGKPLVGAINALAGRRDREAVPALEKLLRHADPAVVAAAANALAAIGAPASAAGMTDSHDKLRLAQRLAVGGDAAAAAGICRALCGTDQPADLRVAALSILSRTARPDAQAMVFERIGDADAFVSASAIRLTGDMKSDAATAALVGKLKSLDPDGQILVLAVLAERRDTSARAAVEALLADGANIDVHVAALSALGCVGGAESVKPLVAAAAGEKGRLQAAAAEALAVLSADGVDSILANGITAGPPQERVTLIAAAAARNLTAALPALLAAARDADESVRIAAAQAVARIGRAEDYAALVNLLAEAADPASRDALGAAVSAVGKRIVDPKGRIEPLLGVLNRAETGAETAASVLRTLGGIGGAEALGALQQRVRSENPVLRGAAIRALAAWAEPAALETLLDIAKNAAAPADRAIALRGLLQLAPTDGRPVHWLSLAQPLAKAADEKRQLLAALARTGDPKALDMAAAMLDSADVTAEAALATTQIAKKLVKGHAGAVDAAMVKVLAVAKDTPDARHVQAEARRIVQAKAQHSDVRRATLAKTLPSDQRLVAYLDCGVEAETGSADGIRLRVTRGQDYDWGAGGEGGHAAASTVSFSGGQVVIEASGLDPRKPYGLGFTWWDYDDNKREESVWISGKQVVEKTVLPAWKGKQQGPASLTRPIPAEAVRDGKIEIAFKQEGAGNCVVSEVWIIEGRVDNAQTVSRPDAAPLFPERTNPGAAKKALIVTGMEYPGHKWRETAPFLRDTISADRRIGVAIDADAKAALESPTLGRHDVIVLNYMNWENPGPGDAAQEGLRRAVANGTGLVLVHFACGAFQSWPEFVKIAGRVWNPKFRGHDPRGPFNVRIVDAGHEIMRGFKDFATDDELYTCLDGDTPIHILADARSKVDHKDYPTAFVLQYGKGRVFLSTLGHDVRALSFPDVKNLYRRATAWAAGLPPES